MKISPECIPCIVHQSKTAPASFTDDKEVLERIVRDTAEGIAAFDMDRSPPEMGAMFNRIMYRALCDPDPYLNEKRRLNRLAFAMVDQLRELIDQSGDPFAAAVRLAMAGNVMDFGAPGGQVDGKLRQLFIEALERPLVGGGDEAIDLLRAKSAEAESILYLADNAGEIVMDRLLIERLPLDKVTLVVRGGPAINDALMEDAVAAGLDTMVKVIDSGAAYPGTPLHAVSQGFRERFDNADLIISKGQGNYETLSGEDAPLFFLLTAKCKVVARQLACEMGDFVISGAG